MAGSDNSSLKSGEQPPTWIVGEPPMTGLQNAVPPVVLTHCILADNGRNDAKPTQIHPHNGRSNQTNRIGDFTILRELGHGGMGVVYEAMQESLQRKVALKVLPLAGRMNQRQIQRFQNEARAAAQLQHPNIVPVYSVGIDGGNHYYAMQLIQGHDLSHYIRHARSLVESKVIRPSGETPRFAAGSTVETMLTQNRDAKVLSQSGQSGTSSSSFPTADFIEMMVDRRSSVAAREVFESIVHIGVQSAEALHYAHQLGIVHRDIKPSNLMLDDHGNVWVTDFGLAQVQGAAALTMTGEVIGTLRYMSPEQPLGQRVLVDQRTDIYSLGVTLYELLTLKKAYGGETPKEIIKQVCFDDPAGIRRVNPHVPEDLETIVLKAMSKNPDDRYQTAQELADDLRRFSLDQPILARRPSLTQQCRRWIRRHAVLATSAAAAVVVLLLTSLAASAVIWNSLTAETQQRKRAESLLDKSEGLRLTATSTIIKDENPGLSLLLAVKGAELNPGVDANSALLAALGSNHELRTFSPRAASTDQLSISPDGNRVVTTVARSYFGKGNYPAIESDLATGGNLRSFDDGTAITSSAYSSDGKYLLTTSAPYRKPASTIPEPDPAGPAESITAVPTLWNAATGDRIITLNEASLDLILGTEFSPASDKIALPGRDHAIKVYATADGRLESSLKGHTAAIASTAFSPDGRRLVSVSHDGTVRVWDAVKSVELRQFQIGAGSQSEPSAVFAGDSDRLVISSQEGTRLFSVDTGIQINPRHWPEPASAVSRDGSQIALFLPFDTRVSILDSRTFRLNAEIDVDDGILSATFDSDGGRLLVTTMSEASVHRTDDGAVAARLKGHLKRLMAGRFTPDGSQVVTTSTDGAVRCWSVRSGTERMTLADRPAWIVPSPWAFGRNSDYAAVAKQAVHHSQLLDAGGLPVSAEFSGRVATDVTRSDRLVTTDDREVVVWNAATSHRIAEFPFETGDVRDARAVPATDVVVVHNDRGSAILWNTATGKRIPTGDSDASVSAFDVHPEDGSVALAQRTGNCLVVDSVTGNIIQTLPHDAEVVSVCFSRTGSKLLTVDSQDTATLWIPDSNRPVLTLHQPDVRFDHAVFSADETFIITWCVFAKDGVRCWRTENGELIGTTPTIDSPGVSLHESLPVAAISSAIDGLLLWNWETGEQLRLTETPVVSPLFLKDRLMTIEAVPGFRTNDSVIRGYGGRPDFGRSVIALRHVSTGELISSQKLSVEPVNLSLDQETGNAVFSFRTHDVSLIRMEDHRSVASVGHYAAPVVFEAIAGETPKVVTASMDGTAGIWDLTGRQLHLLQDHQHPIMNAAISPDGLLLATFDAAGDGLLWSVDNGKSIRPLPGIPGLKRIVRFSASGKQLLTCGTDSAVCITDLISGIDKALAFEPGVLSAEWSPDESRLLIVTGKVGKPSPELTLPAGQQSVPTAFIVEIKTGQKTFLATDGVPQSAKFRPDGKQAAVVSVDGNVTLCDAASGQAVEKFNPNRRRINDVAFSPDGQDLLVMHDDELSLWDLNAGDEILRVPNRDRLRFAQSSLRTPTDWNPFSPDSNWIFSAATRLSKWPRDPLKEALRQVPRPITDAEKRRFSVGLIAEGSDK